MSTIEITSEWSLAIVIFRFILQINLLESTYNALSTLYNEYEYVPIVGNVYQVPSYISTFT